MKNKILSFMLALCLIIPCAFVFAACDKEKTPQRVASELTTDIADKNFVVGQSTEFTFTTVANDDAGLMVYGISNFSDEEAISSLQYKAGETWYDYPRGEGFGPVAGFPMSNATSTFRVTFAEAGEYTFTAFMKTVDGDVELCRTQVTFTVQTATGN